MIPLSVALALKEAGLAWQPRLHDFFAIPDSTLADRLFVVSDMTIDVQQLIGQETITFNGAVEWSLDYILKADVVWVPTESQLREYLQDYLVDENQPALHLTGYTDSYRCQITYGAKSRLFSATTAGEAYGLALLFVLQQEASKL